MTDAAYRSEPVRDARWRLAIWGIPLALLLLPAAAMQVTSEVDWSAGDFVAAGLLLSAAAAAIDWLTLRRRAGWPAAWGVAAVIGLAVAVWIELAVGVFGNWGS